MNTKLKTIKTKILKWLGLLSLLFMIGGVGQGTIYAWDKEGKKRVNPPKSLLEGQSTIQHIRERGKLIAGVKYDFKPFGFINDQGELEGFDIDLIKAMAEEWGIEVEFVQVTSSSRIPKLGAGEMDIVAASMTHKQDREAVIDFSQTYFLDGQSLLVRKDSGIEDIKGLQGKIVAAIEGSTSIEQIQAYADNNEVQIDIFPFTEYPQALEALITGHIDALTTDSVALSQFAQDNEDLIVVGGLFTKEPYGLGLPAGDSQFTDLVNFTLQTLKQNGTYDQLYKQWFGPDSTPYPIEIWPGEWPYTFETSPTTFNKLEQSKVDTLLENGTFVAGVKYDFKPFGFINETGELVGFDIDLMQEFAKRWLGDKNAVELVQVTSAGRPQTLAAGEIDIIAASMTHKWDREESIDFSQTYFLDGQSLLVQKESGIEGIADLDNKVIAAIEGSTSISQIEAYALENEVSIEILPFNEYPQALAALNAGQLDALTTDNVALSQFAQDNPNLVVVGGRFTEEPYGLGVPNYDDQFRDLVNFTLQAMKCDGTYDTLYKKWFGDDAPYNIEIWPGKPIDEKIQMMIYTDSPVQTNSDCSVVQNIVVTPPTTLESTPSPTGIATITPTISPTLSQTATLPITPTVSVTPSPTVSQTPLPTFTPTSHPLPSSTPSPTIVPTLPNEILPTEYTVIEGDWLSKLAWRFYENYNYYCPIYNENKVTIGDNPDLIQVGTVLTIPLLPEPVPPCNQ